MPANNASTAINNLLQSSVKTTSATIPTSLSEELSTLLNSQNIQIENTNVSNNNVKIMQQPNFLESELDDIMSSIQRNDANKNGKLLIIFVSSLINSYSYYIRKSN